MKIQKREGVFETNSSSTHAICVHNQENLEFPEYIYFGLSDLNNDGLLSEIQERANYLHTIMAMGLSKTEYYNLKIKIARILKEKGISNEWCKMNWTNDGYPIDEYDIKDTLMNTIIEKIIPNETLLLHFLFGRNSEVIRGYEENYSYRIDKEKEKYEPGKEYEYFYENY